MLVPLFALALSLSPTEQTTQLEVSASTDLVYLDISYPGAGSARTIAGQGELALKLYLGEPLVDDAAPLSLQPFLQRCSAVTVYGGGGGFDLDAPTWDRHGASATMGFGVGAYAHRNVRLSASFGARYDTWKDSNGPAVTMWQLPISAAIGGRFHDVLIEAGWRVTPTRATGEDFRVPFWGGAFVSATAVLGRRAEVSGSITVANQGAGAILFGEHFFGRRLGVWLRVRGGHQVVEDIPQDWLGGEIGAAYWVTRRHKLELQYGPEWSRYGSSNARTIIAHQLSLGLTARF